MMLFSVLKLLVFVSDDLVSHKSSREPSPTESRKGGKYSDPAFTLLLKMSCGPLTHVSYHIRKIPVTRHK